MRIGVPFLSVRWWLAGIRLPVLSLTGVFTLTGAFVVLSAVLRFLYTNNLFPDDAELALEAADLHGGYSEQPPLYTWMLWAVFRVTGPGLVGHGVVRGGLLLALVGLTYLTARLVAADRRFVAPLACSALLLPAYGWHIATYLTHSLLLGVAVMGTVYAVAQVILNGRTRDYALLGLAVGVGALAKYNFPIVVLAAALAGLTVPAIRPRLLSVRMLVSVAIAGLVLLPHLVWLADHWDDVFLLVQNKSNGAESVPYWDGVATGLGAGALALVTSAALVVPLLVWLGRGTQRVEATSPVLVWLGRFLAALFAIHLVLVFGFGVTRFQDRWLQPLLLPLPLWYLGRLVPDASNERRVLWLNRATAGIALAILAGQVLQIAFVGQLSARYEMRLDYRRLATDLDAAGYRDCAILSPDREILGNLRAYLPETRTWYTTGIRKYDHEGTAVVLLWDGRWGDTPPWGLMPELQERFGSARLLTARMRTFTLHPQDPAGQATTVFAYRLPRKLILGESP